MSRFSLFVDQHTPLRYAQPTKLRVGLDTVNSALWTVGFSKRLSVWMLPTALYQAVALALLQEGVDAAVIAAFEARVPKHFGYKEDCITRQMVRIAIITALSSGLIVMVSRSVAQTPYLNRTAFLLPEFSQSFWKVAVVVVSSRLWQTIPPKDPADNQKALSIGFDDPSTPSADKSKEKRRRRKRRRDFESPQQMQPSPAGMPTHAVPLAHFKRVKQYFLNQQWDLLYQECDHESAPVSISKRHHGYKNTDVPFWSFVDHIVAIYGALRAEQRDEGYISHRISQLKALINRIPPRGKLFNPATGTTYRYATSREEKSDEWYQFSGLVKSFLATIESS